MENNRGFHSLLKLPSLYAGLQSLVGAYSAQRWLLHDHWGLKGFRGRVIDVGCGPGETFEVLPDSEYIGFDISRGYVRQARAKYGARATFLDGSLDQVRNSPELSGANADAVLCLGVLHHLDDGEAEAVVRFAHDILRTGGRFLGIEPTYLIKHSWLSKKLLDQDRGRNIRFQLQWDELIHRGFEGVDFQITTGLYRIPYTHFIYTATK